MSAIIDSYLMILFVEWSNIYYCVFVNGASLSRDGPKNDCLQDSTMKYNRFDIFYDHYPL